MKRIIKAFIFGLASVAVLPLSLLAWIEAALTRSELAFQFGGQLLAPLPGWPGSQLRGAFYFATLRNCSWETHIGFGSLFMHRAASVSTHASMGAYCVIGHADIGAGVMMGSRVSIPSGKRQHFGDAGEIVAEPRYDTVRVGEGSWIGEGAVILADIGVRSVVSAGAVVVKPMPDCSLVGGNPAQVLRSLV